ncbi:MAG: hypothetical protein WC942_01875 [Clostridia bacterium]|jgi:hypothetical protein|nr:hypothetical protein [Clostridia bacterium]
MLDVILLILVCVVFFISLFAFGVHIYLRTSRKKQGTNLFIKKNVVTSSEKEKDINKGDKKHSK